MVKIVALLASETALVARSYTYIALLASPMKKKKKKKKKKIRLERKKEKKEKERKKKKKRKKKKEKKRKKNHIVLQNRHTSSRTYDIHRWGHAPKLVRINP